MTLGLETFSSYGPNLLPTHALHSSEADLPDWNLPLPAATAWPHAWEMALPSPCTAPAPQLFLPGPRVHARPISESSTGM